MSAFADNILGIDRPTAPKIAPPPSSATPAVQAANLAARRRERAASGRASTMLTDQSNLTSPSVSVTKLGGSTPSTQYMGSKSLLG